MKEYILKRVLRSIPLVFGLTTVVFFLLTVLPGNPAANLQGMYATPETTEYLIHKWGLDQPAPVRYVKWLWSMVRLDFGKSLFTNRPVLPQVARNLFNSLYLGFFAIALGPFISIPAGILSAVKRHSNWDYLVTILVLIGVSMPLFWTALLLQLGISVKLGLLPVSGMGEGFFSLERLRHLILPVTAVIFAGAAMDSRVIRSSMLEVINREFILTARSKGLREASVLLRHALPNAFLPAFTMIGLHFRAILGGLLVAEVVFSWPGIGRLFYEAILARDYPVIQACSLAISIGVFTVNLLVDIGYAYIDPRIRFEAQID